MAKLIPYNNNDLHKVNEHLPKTCNLQPVS